MVFARSIGGTLGLAVFGMVLNHRFRLSFLEQLSPSLKAFIGPTHLELLTRNPQVLVSPKAQMRLQDYFQHLGPQGSLWADQLLQAMRQALSMAISRVFLIALVLILIGMVCNVFLKEIPLKKYHDLESRFDR